MIAQKCIIKYLFPVPICTLTFLTFVFVKSPIRKTDLKYHTTGLRLKDSVTSCSNEMVALETCLQ